MDIPPVAADQQKTIFVALVGAPNAGKSTLINQLVGSKVSIVTPKVQTTRQNIRGIFVHEETQLVFIDTPGIFKPKQSLERAIVKTAWQGIREAELIALLIDASKGITPEVDSLIRMLKTEQRPSILLLNKIDKLNRDQLLPLTVELTQQMAFERVFMISALKGDGLLDVKNYLRSQAKPGVWCFAPDDLSDMPFRVWVAELVREQLFLQLQKELPYQLMVQTEQVKELGKAQLRLDVTIYVHKDSQKQIILGTQGNRIKHIGIRVRYDLEKQLGRKVHLFLFVKVRENWFEQPQSYTDLGMLQPN